MSYSEKDLVAYIEQRNFKISHLISEEEKRILQELIEAIAAEFDIATIVSDPDGKPL